VLRGIFGAKKYKMTGDCTEFQNDELHIFLSYNYQVKDDEMGKACSKHGRDDGFTKSFGRETKKKETSMKT
jgi:hypothetical protein